jgi:acyl carrier protein
MYRSGDWARFLPDGNIEFLGRKDHQLKVRGFRIELGEIESALLEHEAVRDAVVLAREDATGNKFLAAYIVSERSLLTTTELRSVLTGRLPEYMIPAEFVIVERMPLTSNCKVDRLELLNMKVSSLESDTAFMSPTTEVEQIIAEIWKDLLQVDRVDVEESFFHLGGHSLLLARIQSRLKEVLNEDIPIISFFKYPTIRSLAEHLKQTQVAPRSFQRNIDRAQARREAAKRRSQPKRSL